MGARTGGEKLVAGGSAPSFSLRRLDGRPQSLTDLLANGPALLAFFKVSCPTCQLAFPYLDRFHQQAAGRFKVAGICQDKDRYAAAFRDEFALEMPLLIDEEERGYPVSNAFGITHVPAIYLVEASGKIAEFQEGFDQAALEQLGARLGVRPFQEGDDPPAWKAG